MNDSPALIPYESIERRILVIRGQKVMLDWDLAELFGVPTKVFNQAVRRNLARFPNDFQFRLAPEEFEGMRSQFVTASKRNIRNPPLAFTEHGAIMAATILNSPRAVEASVWVVRAFVKFRETLTANRLLLKKLIALEDKVAGHDEELKVIVQTLKSLMAPPAKKKRPIGFGAKEQKAKYRAAKKIH